MEPRIGVLGTGFFCLAVFAFIIVVAVILMVRRTGRKLNYSGVYFGQRSRTSSSTVNHSCPSCGAKLAADAPEGLCPRCLLQQGLRTPPPVLSPQPLSPPTRTYEPAAARALADLAPRFPQLELIDFLGMGGMGEVYKARQIKLDRAVALKILTAEAGADSAFAERFTREARALAKLNHSNIVGIYDFGDADGLFYFLMEYVDGVNLRQLMQAGRLEPQQALSIIGQICDALQYAHDEGIVHRDIKPENILIDHRGRVKIADFGLAKLLRRTPVDFSLTGTKQVMGTLHYMAPEQIEKPQSVDHRADIYSLGVLFYEMLTGELPLGRFGLPSERAGTDARLDEIVLHALEKEPDRRYQKVSDVKTAVEALSGASPGLLLTAIPASYYMQKDEDSYDKARSKVSFPAILLQVCGGFFFLVSLFAIGRGITDHAPHDIAGIFVFGGIWGLPAAVFIFIGGYCMYRLRAWGMALAATILCLATTLACLPLGLIGIWPLIVLLNPDTKAAFAANARRPRRKAAPIPQFSDLDVEMVRLQVMGPAAGMMVTGIAAIIFWAGMGLTFVSAERNWYSKDWYSKAPFWLDVSTGAPIAAIILSVAALMFLGARRLMKLKSMGWVFVAIILCMLPWSGPAFLIGLPIAIWTLFVINRPAVKMAFARNALGNVAGAGRPPWPNGPIEKQPTGPLRRNVRSLIGGIKSLFLGSRVRPEDEVPSGSPDA